MSRSERRYQRTASPKNLAETLLALLINKLRNRKVGRLALIDPNSVLLYEEGARPNGAKGNAITFVFYKQIVAGCDTHLVAHRLGQNKPTGAVNGDFGRHAPIMQW